MRRVNLEIHKQNKKFLQNSFPQNEDKSKPSKELPTFKRKEVKEFYLDSLEVLKDSKDKKKIDGLDERIKLLKSELKLLFSDTKSENEYYKCFPDDKSNIMDCDVLPAKHNHKRPSILKIDNEPVEKYEVMKSKHSVPSLKCSPTEFSEWLDKTIDEITVTSHAKKGFTEDNKLQRNSKSVETQASTAAPSILSKFKTSLIFQNRAEQLLFKSFYLQNFEIYLSTSEKNGAELNKSSKKLKKKKYRARKPYKGCKGERYSEATLNKYCGSSQKERKGKKIINENFSKSGMEIIDLVSYSASSNTMQENDLEHVDLNLMNYDWREPFDIKERTEFFSGIGVQEYPKKKKIDNDNRKLKTTNVKLIKNYSSNITLNKSKKNLSKREWECPICFEQSKGQEVVATQCGHIFCKNCLESHISKFSKLCPTCRADLSNKSPIVLFNF